MKPKRIAKFKCVGTDNGGLGFHAEMQEWFDSVTDVLNFLLEQRLVGTETLGELIARVTPVHPLPPWEACPPPDPTKGTRKEDFEKGYDY